jgi:hypothetical protein
VVKGSPLLTLLRRIRRRLRLFAALEGGIDGGAISALVLAASIAIGRGIAGGVASGALGAARPFGWGSGGPLAGAVIVAAVIVGACARGLREIPLERCARLADAALDGQDRVLSAFHLEREAPPPLVAALIADAVTRAGRLAPQKAAPARRPRGLMALGTAAAALAVALLFPIRSPAARPAPETATVAPHVGLPPDALEVEREAARDALAEAARRDDRPLAALAAELARAVRGLSSGKITDGEALEALRSLATRAADAARDAERDRRAAQAAAQALDEHPETRATARALSADEAGSAERARAALGASAEAQPEATARALAAAAQGLAAAAEAAGDPPAQAGPRRLSRPAPGGASDHAPMAGGDPGARRLEQLRRDLDQTSAACRDGDPSCRARAESRADDLSRLAQQGAAADGLRRLGRAADQLRARLGRGELRDGDASAARSFARAADGKSPSARAGVPGERESQGAGTDDDGERSKAGAPPAATAVDRDGDDSGAETGAAATQAETAGPQTDLGTASPPRDGIGRGEGEGIGKQAGGAPLGARDDRLGRGREMEARLASGEGPNRAEVIGSAAGRGFVAGGYARVYSDYAAAVEDALGATAVPEGKRFIVRRYFDLIRPRGPR